MIGNEPNQPRFWLPQFSDAGKPLAAAQYRARARRLLRRAQGRRPDDQRDRRRPLAARQRPAVRARATARARPSASCTTSASPTARASRTKPLMDELAFHPYPQRVAGPAEHRLRVAERRPRRTSTGSSRRSGTRSTAPRSRRSPRPARPPSKPLRFDLDEVGWQVAPLPALASLYTGVETAGTKVVSEDDQATLLRRHDHARRVRSRRADAQLLPPGRRDRPRPLAERARARRRLAPALVRRGQADDRPDARQLPGRAGQLAARDRRRPPDRGVGEPQAAAAQAHAAGASPRAPARRPTSAPGSSRPGRRRRSSASGSRPAGRSRCSCPRHDQGGERGSCTFRSAGSSAAATSTRSG